MLLSDTTVARVLTWLKPWQSRQFLQSFVDRFEELGLLEKALQPGGQPRRIGILDGSVMGGHHHVTFCLHGSIDYPFLIEDQGKRGKELPTALRVLNEAHARLGPRFPDLLLCDSLYFNAKSFKSAREKGAHILIKCSNPEFRIVLQDAQFLFEHNVTKKIERESGFDGERFCHWSIEKTSGEFAGYPIQIAHLVEDYPKRTKNAHVESWIVTTESRIVGVNVDHLKNAKRILAIAAGADKEKALRGALRTGLLTDIFIDEELASRIVD